MLKEFKKSDLKDGMVVETRNEDLYFVFNGRLLGKDGCWGSLTDFNENLSLKYNLIEYDIIRIFTVDATKVFCLYDLLIKDNLNLLWEEEIEEPIDTSDIQNKFKNITDDELLEEVKRRFK